MEMQETLKYHDEKKCFNTKNVDIRAKMFILIIANLSLIFSQNLFEEFILEISILIFGILLKQYRFILKIFFWYLIVLLMQYLGGKYLSGMLNVFIVTFAVFIRRLFPCAMLGGVIIGTTRVNEFMAAMNRLHISKKIVIPIAIMFRYFPMIKEEWNAIKDAMKMRGISPSIIGFIKHPAIIIECIYVPILMSASKISDELTTAAITRGIENPKRRTCMQSIKFTISDFICTSYFCILFILLLVY